jgi:hypothetical protein
MILPKIRDPRFITIRRGGSLSDANHHLLSLWAADCAEHVLALFNSDCPGDERPREAIEAARAWARKQMSVTDAKRAAWEANNAARPLIGAAKFAALSAGQAAVVCHVAAHELGAAAYAIRARMASSEHYEMNEQGRIEREWQMDQLPIEIKELVVDDEKNRNDICWNAFSVR